MDEIRPDRRRFLQGTAATAAGLALAGGTGSPSGAAESRLGILDCLGGDKKTGTSQAVVVGDYPLVHTEQVYSDERSRQSEVGQIFNALRACLRQAGASIDDVVRFHFYIGTNKDLGHEGTPKHVGNIQSALAHIFPDDYQPAVTYVTGKVAHPKGTLAADCVAVRRTQVEPGKVLRVPGAAVLPPRDKLYVSGDAHAGNVKTATLETLKSLENTLKFAKLDWSHVVQLKSFLEPIDAARDVRKWMQEFFDVRPLPVLSFVEWSSPKLPIEIELIATVPPEHGNTSGDTVEYLTPPGVTASPVYSRAARVRSEKTIYTSGLYGETTADAPKYVRELLGKVRELSEAAKSDLKHLVKGTYYVSDAGVSDQFGKIRPEFYDPQRPPAASKALTRGTGRDGHPLTVDMIAVPK